jgi:S-adenosylmethionine uptake transporter
MGVCVKLASEFYSTAEIVAYRGGIGMIIILALLKWQRGTLRTTMPTSHAWRGLFGTVSLWLWFYSMSKLPLSLAITLSYMSSIWMAVILFVTAWWKYRGQKQPTMQPSLVLAIGLGFIGVILLLRPTIRADQIIDSLYALTAGFIAALAYIQVRGMGVRGEPEYRVVFYFSTICTIAGFIGAAFPLSTYSTSQLAAHSSHVIYTTTPLLLLLGVGITATIAQLAMTRAYRLGNPLVAANLQYVGIVFTSGFDLLIWNISLSWVSWCGIVIILGSGMIATYYNNHEAS